MPGVLVSEKRRKESETDGRRETRPKSQMKSSEVWWVVIIHRRMYKLNKSFLEQENSLLPRCLDRSYNAPSSTLHAFAPALPLTGARSLRSSGFSHFVADWTLGWRFRSRLARRCHLSLPGSPTLGAPGSSSNDLLLGLGRRSLEFGLGSRCCFGYRRCVLAGTTNCCLNPGSGFDLGQFYVSSCSSSTASGLGSSSGLFGCFSASGLVDGFLNACQKLAPLASTRRRAINRICNLAFRPGDLLCICLLWRLVRKVLDTVFVLGSRAQNTSTIGRSAATLLDILVGVRTNLLSVCVFGVSKAKLTQSCSRSSTPLLL